MKGDSLKSIIGVVEKKEREREERREGNYSTLLPRTAFKGLPIKTRERGGSGSGSLIKVQSLFVARGALACSSTTELEK